MTKTSILVGLEIHSPIFTTTTSCDVPLGFQDFSLDSRSFEVDSDEAGVTPVT